MLYPKWLFCLILSGLVSIATTSSMAATTATTHPVTSSVNRNPGRLILVQPGAAYSSNPGGDLHTLREYYRGASWESPIRKQAWDYLKKLKVNRFRLINVEPHSYGPTDAPPDKQHFIPSPRLKSGLADCQNYKVNPHIIVGQWAIPALANKTSDGKYYGIKDWKRYKEYAYQFIKYVAIQKNFPNAVFEVGNEPDTGKSWLLDKKYPNGSLPLFNAYFRLYKVWAGAVGHLSQQYPKLNLKIGGPAITAYSTGLGDFQWGPRFIRQCAAQGVRLDFFSCHVYGNQQAIGDHQAFGPYPRLSQEVTNLRHVLREAGKSDMPIYLTEWGPSSDVYNSKGAINANHVGAAWSAKFMIDLVANHVNNALALIFRDHNQWKKGHKDKDNWYWPGYLTMHGKYPKALYNAFLMFQMLPGHRVESSVLRGSVGTFATASSSAIGILVYNCNWNFTKHYDMSKPQTIHIKIAGSHFDAKKMFGKQIAVQVYRIDKTHSNAYHHIVNNKPIDINSAQLQRIASYQRPIKNDTINLPGITLPPSSVTLWIVQAGHKK